MKKSEALQVIKEYLDINNGNLVPEQVLAIVEKIGMQPPNYTKNPDQWYRSTGDYGYELAEWEEE